MKNAGPKGALFKKRSLPNTLAFRHISMLLWSLQKTFIPHKLQYFAFRDPIVLWIVTAIIFNQEGLPLDSHHDSLSVTYVGAYCHLKSNGYLQYTLRNHQHVHVISGYFTLPGYYKLNQSEDGNIFQGQTFQYSNLHQDFT